MPEFSLGVLARLSHTLSTQTHCLQYRGTQVAVRRVIPPKSAKERAANDELNKNSDHSPHSSSVGMRSGTYAMKSGSNTDVANGSWASASLSRYISGTSSQVPGAKSKSIFGQSDAAKWRKMKQDFIEEMRYLSKLRYEILVLLLLFYFFVLTLFSTIAFPTQASMHHDNHG